ncbi:hypothetical protein [Clostridium beijerinckii]|uniref:Uncharacterized protein n=1 Tax=Clostridium beijerinckii TaxID=1520 RepID=A0AAW3W6X4_CLOBE|nr:hypothetical protein [Clostridium beijerinckii]MBC2457534.1 hypothetical protein [Clostridium beijerinckii]MBC2474641.1 hypothetical protein [Clostridium beijerinckii]NOV62402.1 hypothetical protein [Clostridium beijerinckii]NOV68101.1 hypothetical protein [Clostridium beijerinckii]NOW30454.1 hypothetical protein [Clostridium beijerinckii]
MKIYERKYKEIMCEFEKNKKSYKRKREICQKILLTKKIYIDRQIVRDMMGLKSVLEVDDELLLNLEEIEEELTGLVMIADEIDELRDKELGKIKVFIYWSISKFFKEGVYTKEMFYKKFKNYTEEQRTALFSGKYRKIV